MMDLDLTLCESYPHMLSGGEQQKVGIARALVTDPPILLMDEPFGALDPITRKGMQREFLALKKQMNKTVVFVTHDIEEALLLGDRIALIDQGELQQIGSPSELVQKPESEFVDRFFKSLSIEMATV